MNHSNETLINNFRLGDKAAFNALYVKYWRILYIQAYKKLDSHKDAEEILQALFVELWERRESINPENLEAFLRGAIRNKCVDLIRRRARKEKYIAYYNSFVQYHKLSTEDDEKSIDLAEAIRNGLHQLPEKSKLVFRLHKIEGFSHKEVAQKMQLSEKSIEYHLTKAMKVIRVYLRDYMLLIVFLLKIS